MTSLNEKNREDELAALVPTTVQYFTRMNTAVADQGDFAKDLAQEALIRLWNKDDIIRGVDFARNPRRVFRGFEKNIQQQANRDIERDRAKRKRFYQELLAERGVHRMSLEDTTRVRIAVERLPERLQRVVRLRFFEGLTYSEIANALKYSEATIRNWLNEAYSELRGILMT